MKTSFFFALALCASSASAAVLRGSVAAVDCTSAKDQSAWSAITATLGSNVNDCAGLSSGCVSIFSGVNQACVNTCMESKKSFTNTCSPAFGALADCGFKNCKTACISGDPTATSCIKCNEQYCDPAFHASTGFTVTCSQIPECNGAATALEQ